MTITAPGRVPMTNPRAAELRDLTNKAVQDEVLKTAQRNAELTRLRLQRAARKRAKQL